MDLRADDDRGDRDRGYRQFDSNADLDPRPDVFVCAARDRYFRGFSVYISLDFADFNNLYVLNLQRFFAVHQIKNWNRLKSHCARF